MRTCIAFMLVVCVMLTAGDQGYAKALLSGEDDYSAPSHPRQSLPTVMPTLLSDEDDYAENPDLVVNRPVNVQGLTGLIFTNSAYTQAKGSIVVGVAAIAEDSKVPNYSIVQGIATITAGIMDRVELGARTRVIATNLGSSTSRQSGSGDTDLMVKWRVSSQGDTKPAIALGLGYTLPTGERTKGLSEIQHEGIRFMVLGSSEKEMPQGFLLGIYGDLQLVLNDQIGGARSTKYSDKYGVFNGGVLLPLTESRQFQALLEYSKVFKKDRTTLNEKDYSAVMPGLRFVTPKFNISLGVQFMSKDQANVKDDQRYVGTLSYKF